ncbi:hypothetical protein PAER4782_11485 [Pseudomonas aeruginosa]|nr:hypothetical protein PAER4782_11485 [Pseudomonas aeruginosa]CAI9907673.1 hypothetical protein PAER4782_11485 [Pseudomonas aeruginosa]
MGGRITVESVVRCSWNGWPDDRGIRTVDHYIERFKYQCKTSTVNSMAKLLKVAEAASSGNEVVQIAVYGRRKQVYTLHPA